MISFTDFYQTLPIVIIAISALIIILIETFIPPKYKSQREKIIYYFSIFSLVVAINFAFKDIDKNLILYHSYLKISSLSVVLNIILLIGILITVLSSRDYLQEEGINYGEYYSLLLISLLGMMLMVSANDLITVFIGVEMMSIGFYILAGFMRRKAESNESALKYFLLGAFLTGILLLGIAFVYGSTGSLNFTVIATSNTPLNNFYLLGLIFILITFVFKTGSVPVQMWVPDVYQGAPSVIAGMMSSVGKTAAFGTMIVLFSVFDYKNVSMLIAVIAVLTMLYGNVVALLQDNVKRLLAYSSIAHAGYLMLVFTSINQSSVHALMFYLIVYVLMQMGAFVTLALIEEKYDKTNSDLVSRNSLNSYKGLGKTNPWLASLFTIFLLSLAGIPPFAGFWAKYYIFLAVIQNEYLWAAIVGIMLSLVGVYYYIRIILYMWFKEPEEGISKIRYPEFTFTVLVLSTLGLVVFGFFPELVFKVIKIIP